MKGERCISLVVSAGSTNVSRTKFKFYKGISITH